MKKYNQRMCVSDVSGGWKLRIFHRKGQRKQSPRLRIKCGCCDESVDIYYDNDYLDPSSTVVVDCGKLSSYFTRVYENFLPEQVKM